jgi:hypothetical protein
MRKKKYSSTKFMGFISFLASLYFGSWELKLECENLNTDCLLNLATKPSEKIIILEAFLVLGFICFIIPSIFQLLPKRQKVNC